MQGSGLMSSKAHKTVERNKQKQKVKPLSRIKSNYATEISLEDITYYGNTKNQN